MKKILFILIFVCLPFPHYVNNNHLDYNTLNRQTPGDLNSDGIINVQDIILLVNLVLNSEYDSLGDLNFDNIVNVLDVVQVVNAILYGFDEQECVEEEYSTVNILTNIDEQIYNDDESINAYSIYSWTSDNINRILSGNGIPNHEVGTFPNPNCPNTISEQNVNHTFALYPEIISEEGQSLGGPSNTIAYALNLSLIHI